MMTLMDTEDKIIMTEKDLNVLVQKVQILTKENRTCHIYLKDNIEIESVPGEPRSIENH